MLVANSRLLVVSGLDVYALVRIFCFFAHPGRNCQDCIGKPGRCPLHCRHLCSNHFGSRLSPAGPMSPAMVHISPGSESAKARVRMMGTTVGCRQTQGQPQAASRSAFKVGHRRPQGRPQAALHLHQNHSQLRRLYQCPNQRQSLIK